MQERDKLLEEVRSLKLTVANGGQGDQQDSDSDVRYLRSKVFHYEKLVTTLEQDKNSLSVKYTMASEHMKLMEASL